ncbi:MAG: transcription termination/antitermination NusG family protein [Luteolibacter sp.]
MTAAPPTSAAWYCVRTQTKREHIAAGHLRSLEGVDVFCPRLRYRKATRRGKIWWIEPFFPGYLLARFERSTMERGVTFAQGVRGLVRFGTNVPTVPESFIQTLRGDIGKNPDAEAELLTLLPSCGVGDEVEIADGPFQGMKGSIVEILPAAERVKVLLDFLGQQQAVNLDLYSLLLPRRPLPES